MAKRLKILGTQATSESFGTVVLNEGSKADIVMDGGNGILNLAGVEANNVDKAFVGWELIDSGSSRAGGNGRHRGSGFKNMVLAMFGDASAESIVDQSGPTSAIANPVDATTIALAGATAEAYSWYEMTDANFLTGTLVLTLSGKIGSAAQLVVGALDGSAPTLFVGENGARAYQATASGNGRLEINIPFQIITV